MWKWIVGVLLVIVVLLAGTCYYAYKKLTAGGDSATIAIAGSPDRVFGLLADPDSMVTWMNAGPLAGGTHGMLKSGDTLRLSGTSMQAGGSGSRRSEWIVSQVEPGRLLVLQMSDSLGKVAIVQRDSLTTRGDSTIVTTTFGAPMFDDVRERRADSGKGGEAVIGLGQKIVVSALRLEWEQELPRLKARVEGKSLPQR